MQEPEGKPAGHRKVQGGAEGAHCGDNHAHCQDTGHQGRDQDDQGGAQQVQDGKRHAQGEDCWTQVQQGYQGIIYHQCCRSGSGAFLPPGSGINFFQIPDPKGMFFGEIFLRILVLLFFTKLVPETISSKKKVGFIFHPSFYVQ
jgi:hypothetical protein